jgi:predicted nucleic acid-binding protein
MRRRIYTDTSVIGGCLDEEFEEPSQQLFDRFRSGQDIVVISELTLLELEGAPNEVREVLERVPSSYREDVEFTEAAADLAERYLQAEVVGRASRLDAQHIATATVHRADVLVSWNFKHVVNLNRIQGYNSVNLRQGYPLLEIRSPREVLSYDR